MARLNAWFDRLGAIASALCALHCAAVPLLFLWIPAFTIGLRSWSNPHHGIAAMLWATLYWEWAVVVGVLAFATAVLLAGYIRHRRFFAFLPAAIGGALMASAVSAGVTQSLWLHTTLMVSGGTLLSLAHLANMHAMRRCRE